MTGLIENLGGPHEWGYRDPAEGGFVPDDAPFQAAATIAEMLPFVRMVALIHCPDAWDDAKIVLTLNGGDHITADNIRAARALLRKMGESA